MNEPGLPKDPELPELTSQPVQPSCRRAAEYLGVAAAVSRRLLSSAQEEDHPLHAEDLLRSMLVFACAGMDRTCKALLEDAFGELAKMDRSVEDPLAKFSVRMIAPGGSLNPQVLARLMLDPWTPRDALVRAFVDDLTGDSLQSVEQLFRIFNALRVQDSYVREHRPQLAGTFRARNQIVHEMDLTESESRPTRHSRSRSQYVELAGEALSVASHLVHEASEVIFATAARDPYWASMEEFKRPSSAPIHR